MATTAPTRLVPFVRSLLEDIQSTRFIDAKEKLPKLAKLSQNASPIELGHAATIVSEANEKLINDFNKFIAVA